MAGAYLLGSIPSGVFLARQAGIDVRRRGSGNIGATNVARSAGWRLGFLTLGADAAKGILPVAVSLWLGLGIAAACLAALATVGGHLFPLFGGFRGGKGVATTLGILLVLAPDVVLAEVAVFAVLVSMTRIVSVGSLGAAVLLPLALWLFRYPGVVVATGAALGVAILWRHADNIARLRAGREPRLR